MAGTGAILLSQSAAAQVRKPEHASVAGLPFEARANVRMGLIGCGERGSDMLKEYLGVDGLTVTAVCDVVKDAALHAQAAVERAGQHPPAVYAKGERDFENLLKRDDVDFAYMATPWEWHVPMALAAMNSGKHAFVEVPAAATIEDCWKLVDTSEKTRRHCIMMENCCYGYNELLVLNMVRAGLFGDLLYGEGAYLHDLRRLLFEDRSEGLWRRFPHTRRNGNLYPTHGLGPVANYMGINRGDRFDYLVSMSSSGAGPGRVARGERTEGQPEVEGKVYLRGFEHIADQDGQRADDHPAARRGESASLRPDQPDCGGERDFPRLSAAHLFRRSEGGGVYADRQIQGRSTSIRCGSTKGNWRASWAGTAAWTS